MIIPFITPIALVWHFPVRVQKRAENDMQQMLMSMLGKREDFSQEKQEPRYEETELVHWKPCLSPDDLPPDISVKDIKVNSLRTQPIERDMIVLDRKNMIIHRQGHTWLRTVVEERRGFMRGIVAGIVRRPWVAERWIATGSLAGVRTIEVPQMGATL